MRCKMKYKVISEKIKKDVKECGAVMFTTWIKSVDGKVVDFKDGEEVAMVDSFIVHKDWCEPIENVSCETICDNKNTIEKVKDYCIKNIERIDRMTETAISTDADIGMNYAYRKILDIIESEGKNND